MNKDFSTEVDERGKRILEKAGSKYLGKVCRDDVTEKVRILSGMVTVMMEHLKRDHNYDHSIDRSIRHVVAMSMEKGVRVGRKYGGTPEELMEILSLVPIHPNKLIEKLPKRKQKLAKYVLHSFLLGKLSYETGLAISATLSKSQRVKYLKQLEDETCQYIR